MPWVQDTSIQPAKWRVQSPDSKLLYGYANHENTRSLVPSDNGNALLVGPLGKWHHVQAGEDLSKLHLIRGGYDKDRSVLEICSMATSKSGKTGFTPGKKKGNRCIVPFDGHESSTTSDFYVLVDPRDPVADDAPWNVGAMQACVRCLAAPAGAARFCAGADPKGSGTCATGPAGSHPTCATSSDRDTNDVVNCVAL